MFLFQLLFTLLCCLGISSELFAQEITSNTVETSINTQRCPLPVFNKIALNEAPITDDKIKIFSQYSSIEKDQIAHFSGNVTLIDKTQKIIANELSFNNLSMEMTATGNIQYQSKSINVFAEDLIASKATKTSTMTDASYQLKNSPIHGSATELFLDVNGVLKLQSANFTTCVGESPDWQLRAAEITLSTEGDYGEAYGAQFRVFDVPVFYTPYFSFPLSQKRKTGFLIPTFGSSSSVGLDIETPFYWNISESIDATITPRYMSKRGLQLINEFRYLSGMQSGQINFEYLNNDSAINNNSARYLARLQHVGTISDNFRLYIDFTTISDDNYLVDLGSEQYNSNDAYLYQLGELSYFGENWQAKLQLQDFEVLGDHEQGYKTLPHIEIQSQHPLAFWQGQFELYSELSHFQTTDELQPKTNRFHIEAGLLFPISTPSWFFNSEIKLLQTYYQQDNLVIDSILDDKVSRTLPKIRFHGGINFDRTMSFFNKNYRQTLEPQLQYLYIPEVDQSNIGLYDTTRLQDDYNGLFRDRRYSGLDRIAAANQYTLGITSRLLDSSNVEIFRISFGRITYFNDSNPDNILNSIDGITNNGINNSARSSLATDIFFRFNRQWQISGDLQYDTDENYANKSQVNIDYRFDSKNIVQLNHRYIRDVSNYRLEQVSLLASLALNKDWAFVGRITQDIQQKRSLESYAGIQYESCCWAIRFAYQRHINSNFKGNDFDSENRDEFDSGFMVQFIFKGLNGKQETIGTEDMFNSSIFGYKRPYFLNN